MLSRSSRSAVLLLAALFAASPAALGLPHSCVADVDSAPASQAITGHAGHGGHAGSSGAPQEHRHDQQPGSKDPRECCVGLSCCSSGATVPVIPALPALLGEPADGVPQFQVRPIPSAWAKHLFPPAIGPPPA